MRPVSGSTDELMWLIAEQGEPAAIEAFAKRYPEHRGELLKRVNMVRELKGSRPRQVGIPSFEPRTPTAAHAAPTLRIALVGLPLVAVLLASYWFTSAALRRQDAALAVRTDWQPRSYSQAQPTPLDTRPPGPPWSRSDAQDVRPEPPPPPSQRLVTLRSDRTTLLEVLNEISRSTGLRFELAPDVPNQEISVDYSGLPALTVLKDMGLALGFTAFDQGDGTILVIPAVDPKAQDAPPLVAEGGTKAVDQPPAGQDDAGVGVSVPHRP